MVVLTLTGIWRFNDGRSIGIISPPRSSATLVAELRRWLYFLPEAGHGARTSQFGTEQVDGNPTETITDEKTAGSDDERRKSVRDESRFVWHRTDTQDDFQNNT